MSDYYDSDEVGIIEPLEPERRKIRGSGSLKMGLLVGIGLTLVLEAFVGLVLDAQNNLVHRYISYMLGIGILFVVSVIVVKPIKMFFLATPIIIATSFVLPYFLPDYFTGLMAPFLTLLPIIQRVSETPYAQEGIENIDFYMTLVNDFGILLDLVLAVIVGSIAGLGLSFLVKLVRTKFGFFHIFYFTFGIFFFVLGVLILPYVLIILTGAIQFGSSFAVGGLALAEGFQFVNEGDLDTANDYFAEAQEWFAISENMLKGLVDMQLFNLVGFLDQRIKPIVDNGILLAGAAVDLAQGVAPTLAGVGKMQSGITQAMGVLTPGSSLSLSALSNEDITTFNGGLDLMEQGFANISSAIPEIQQALDKIASLDQEELNSGLEDLAGMSIANETALLDGGAALFSATLDVLEVLITAEGTNRAPFIHLLYGALALSQVSESIGESTSFEGTGSLFEDVVGNLTIVVDTFDDPVFDDFETADVGSSAEIVEARDQISGIFEFIKDAGNISISIGEFGIIAPPTLNSMNDSLSIFTTYDNFTVIPDAVYDEKISVLDDVYVNASIMQAQGRVVDDKVATMQAKSTNGTYGLMSDAGSEFVTVFTEFNLTENGANFYYLAGGFSSIMQTVRTLKVVDGYIDNIKTSSDIIQDAINTVDIPAIQPALEDIDANLTLADAAMNESQIYIANAVGNFTLLGDSMPQMAGTATAFTNISTKMTEIQGRPPINAGIYQIRVISERDWTTNFPTDAQNNFNEVVVELDYITLKFSEITAETGNIGIAS